MKKVIKVEGMSCEHCKKRVEDALKGVAGVSAVEVSLEAGEASFEYGGDMAAVKAAVEDAGYDVMF